VQPDRFYDEIGFLSDPARSFHRVYHPWFLPLWLLQSGVLIAISSERSGLS
jgi:hypothetical protein